MKNFLFLFIILPLTVLAQTKELQIKGIKVGTYYSTVIKKLGKPLSLKKNGEYDCDSGLIRTAQYNGLFIDFLESNLNGKLFVARVKITSPKWKTVGIKVGDDLRKIKGKFSLSREGDEDGFIVYTGLNGDGYSYFYFKRNKLVKFSWELNTC